MSLCIFLSTCYSNWLFISRRIHSIVIMWSISREFGDHLVAYPILSIAELFAHNKWLQTIILPPWLTHRRGNQRQLFRPCSIHIFCGSGLRFWKLVKPEVTIDSLILNWRSFQFTFSYYSTFASTECKIPYTDRSLFLS